MIKRCIYTGTEFEFADGEHILQNFLGCRWTSNEIVCNEAQAMFGKTIDLGLEFGLREIRNLLGTKGGRGDSGPTLKNIDTLEGNRYHILPGGVPKIAVPLVSIRPVGDGSYIAQIKLGEMKQRQWAIAKLREDFPTTEFLITEENFSREQQYFSEKLHLGSSIGGSDYFRGLLKSAFNLLGATHPAIALLPCFDSLRRFVLAGTGSVEDFIRWLPKRIELPNVALGAFDHFIGISSNGASVDGIVQFFGGISHLVRLTAEYEGPRFLVGYQVNPLRDSDPAEARMPSFDISMIPQFNEGHRKPGSSARSVYSDIFSRFLEKHYQAAYEREILRIVDNALSPHFGEPLSEKLLDQLGSEVAAFFVSRAKPRTNL